MGLRVECYAGRKAAERPLRFWLDQRAFTVAEVLEEWYEPEAQAFKIRADDGRLYVLRHRIHGADTWELSAES